MLRPTSFYVGILAVGSLAAGIHAQPSPAPRCRHEEHATEADRNRRARTLTVAKAINAMQAELVRRTGQYHPAENLRLPEVPAGFELNLFVNRSGYLFAIKDMTDPCRFAVFSDEGGLIYEKSALEAPVVAQ
jgi:hypothetical protein